MSPLRLNGSTSGNVTLDAPAVSGNNTLVLPTGNGTSGQFLQTNGSGALSFASAVVNGSSSAIVSGTAQNSTSGTSIDFTGIPSWVKRVTVMFNGVSGSGSSPFVIQLGTSSGVDSTSTYGGSASYGGGGTTEWNSTSFRVSASGAQTAAALYSGVATLVLLGSNTWCESGTLGPHSSNAISYSGGAKTLSGTLDRVRITTVNGTDTFDAGSINILYE
jgi:hypothetical protein